MARDNSETHPITAEAQDFKEYKNEGKYTPTKEYNAFLVVNPKEIEMYKLPAKEFKTTVFRKISELEY